MTAVMGTGTMADMNTTIADKPLTHQIAFATPHTNGPISPQGDMGPWYASRLPQPVQHSGRLPHLPFRRDALHASPSPNPT